MINKDETPEIHVLRALFLDEAEGHLQRMADAYTDLCHAATAPDYNPGPEVDILFRALHTLKGAAGSVGHDGIMAAAHELEDLCADLRSGAIHPTPGILDVLNDDLQALRALVGGARMAAGKPDQRQGENIPRPIIDRRHRPQTDQPVVGDRRNDNRSVRIESEQLDHLLDGVGDLVILRTRMERRIAELEGLRRDLHTSQNVMRRVLKVLFSGESEPPPVGGASSRKNRAVGRLSDLETELAASLSHLERAATGLVADGETLRRHTERLDETVRQARLQRLEGLFHRLAAALREINRDPDKQVQLATSGGDLELDKAVLERLHESFLHLLRNAVIHGIESVETRRRLGKPDQGRIEITAHIENGFVFVTFSDDGQGVDRDAVRTTLIQEGRLTGDAQPSDETLLAALFDPGFSTRTRADAMAGRGIGLDVVRTTVVQLGGAVTCQSEPDQGTRFRISFPLVTAITQALLFKVGGQVYAVPAAHVAEILPPSGVANDGAPPPPPGWTRLPDGCELPVVRLQSLLGVEMPPDHRTAALHIRYGDRDFVLICDRLIGLRTIVVRPLGALLGSLPLYAGVTISGSGKAQLVLDLGFLAGAATDAQRLPTAMPRRGPPRVLVADDSRLARESTSRILATEGLHVVTAEDGWEAWELLNERRFDVLVTDLEMPRLDGFHLLARIRREATLRDLPVILVTSRAGRPIRERAFRLGANLVIPKSPNRRPLILGVRDLLTQRRPNGAGP